jgi:hypothetical protein
MSTAKSSAKKTTAKPTDPPLFSFSVTNPITYLKKWWKQVMRNEGVDLRMRIHPVTAFAIAGIMIGAGFGVGRVSVPPQIAQYIPAGLLPSPTPTPNPWRITTLTGTLHTGSGGQYYLVTQFTEAITLQLPTDAVLTAAIGKRVLLTGLFNDNTKTLRVDKVGDMQVITQSLPVRTSSGSGSLK